jgi:hypothetical protein
VDSTQKELLVGLATKILQMLDEADEDGSLRQVTYKIESLLANEYGVTPDDIARYLHPSESETTEKVTCFVCGLETADSTAEKLDLAQDIRGYLCESCNQIRLFGKSDRRDYSELSDEEKNLLDFVNKMSRDRSNER